MMKSMQNFALFVSTNLRPNESFETTIGVFLRSLSQAFVYLYQQIAQNLHHQHPCPNYVGSGSPVWTNGGVPHGGEKKNLFNGGDGM